MWIGTAGGLNLFDRKNKTFTAYTEKDGLPNNVINGILEDDHGNLWLSTNQGISQFNIDTKKCRNYDTSDGLQGNEYNRNACYKAADGRMYFGGNRGFNVFHPDSIEDNPYVPPVVLSDIQIFNESVRVGSPGSILQQAINLTKEIFLNYQHSVVTLHYASLNFITPEKNQYAYQLKGFDKDWNFVGNKRLATYINLDPGTYTFRVIASNNDGIWNEQGASLVINILPPFWGTWWFRLLAILLVAGMGIIFYSYRLHSIKRLNQKLIIVVDERTRELVYKQDQISAQNEVLLGVNAELSSKQAEVASQRDMLAMQNQELSEVREKIIAQNLSLDQEVKERTRELVDYNQQLEQFAFIAAHNLRAPVARVLGLGQLLKLPNVSLEEKKTITEKMAYTAEELDQVVKDINTILEIRKNHTLSITEINLSQEVALVKENLINEISCTQAEIFCFFLLIGHTNSAEVSCS